MTDDTNEHLFDFSNMPLTPAQETVELLKQIVVLLTPVPREELPSVVAAAKKGKK